MHTPPPPSLNPHVLLPQHWLSALQLSPIAKQDDAGGGGGDAGSGEGGGSDGRSVQSWMMAVVQVPVGWPVDTLKCP